MGTWWCAHLNNLRHKLQNKLLPNADAVILLPDAVWEPLLSFEQVTEQATANMYSPSYYLVMCYYFEEEGREMEMEMLPAVVGLSWSCLGRSEMDSPMLCTVWVGSIHLARLLSAPPMMPLSMFMRPLHHPRPENQQDTKNVRSESSLLCTNIVVCINNSYKHMKLILVVNWINICKV